MITSIRLEAKDKDTVAELLAGKQSKQTRQYIKQLRAAAVRKDATAQCLIGYLMIQGIGVKQSFEKGLVWLQRAAQQGFGDAQVELGSYLLAGYKMRKDVFQAVKWLQLAAAQNYAQSQYLLGLLFQWGDDDWSPNLDQAIYWYETASAHGHPQAQCNLGLMCTLGMGMPKQCAKALQLFIRSHRSGCYEGGRALVAFCMSHGAREHAQQIAQEIYFVRPEQNGGPEFFLGEASDYLVALGFCDCSALADFVQTTKGGS